uniref:Secreted protein n=1 Tax=Globodera rostochiensis TaxID=31243 RepID=A0A914I406_GLORO
MVFVGGLGIDVLVSAFVLVVKKNCNCYLRHNPRCQRKNNRSTNSQTLEHLADRSRQPLACSYSVNWSVRIRLFVNH